ncbi:hypothetical protein PT974_05443 [Cladobotryum mycophilum]|uniref:Uncharacterized protein n=1 Tax=Cladobotryum mycophilum TaxID=491253 RepID=A0ABR0SIS9_9HYPO
MSPPSPPPPTTTSSFTPINISLATAYIAIPSAPSPSPCLEPPLSPHSWTWRCPCGRLQPIACKRCLNCSELFKPNRQTVMNGAARTKNSIQYDYQGWQDWLNWRHDHAEFAANPERWQLEAIKIRDRVDEKHPHHGDLVKDKCVEEWRRIKRKARRAQRFAKKTHDCSIDCFFPGECKLAASKHGTTSPRPASGNTSDQENTPPTSAPRRATRSASPSLRDGIANTGLRVRAATPRPRRRRARLLSHQRWKRTRSWLNPNRHQPESPRSPPPE